MACPRKVARNAPAIPITVVRMKPVGLFGPGESMRAMMPATKPTMMTQMMPLMDVVLPQWNNRNQVSAPRSDAAGHFVVVRQPSIRRQVVDHLRQILAEAVEQVVARHAALRCELVDLIGAQGAVEIAGRDRLVRAFADPLIRPFPLPLPL